MSDQKLIWSASSDSLPAEPTRFLLQNRILFGIGSEFCRRREFSAADRTRRHAWVHIYYLEWNSVVYSSEHLNNAMLLLHQVMLTINNTYYATVNMGYLNRICCSWESNTSSKIRAESFTSYKSHEALANELIIQYNHTISFKSWSMIIVRKVHPANPGPI
jgi:hypothetical protein